MVGKAGTGITETVECAFGFKTEEFAIFFLQPFRSKYFRRGTIIQGIRDIELVEAGPLAFVFMRSLAIFSHFKHLIMQRRQIVHGRHVHVATDDYLGKGIYS